MASQFEIIVQLRVILPPGHPGSVRPGAGRGQLASHLLDQAHRPAGLRRDSVDLQRGVELFGRVCTTCWAYVAQ